MQVVERNAGFDAYQEERWIGRRTAIRGAYISAAPTRRKSWN